MSMFKDMLKDNETLFTSNVEALDFDYIPKLVPHRDNEQRQVAMCIKPIFQKRNGKNILLHGKPGVGKTVAVKHLLKELEEETDDLFPVFINCWQKNTTFKILTEVCDQLGYKFIQNKNSDDLVNVIVDIVNKNLGVVFVFDEVDKVDDLDFMYLFLEKIYRKSIVLITNYKAWLDNLDERIKSRLVPDVLEFKEYNEFETKDILKQRIKYAFIPDCWEDEAFDILAKKAYELKDLRTGLFLMKEAGQNAEDNSRKKITLEDAQYAVSKLDGYSKSDEKKDLELVDQQILELIKNNSGEKIGNLFKEFEKISDLTYKTFQRKIKKLELGNYIHVEKIVGGLEGKTSIIHYGQVKKLTDF